MKWLLIFGLVVIVGNAPATLAHWHQHPSDISDSYSNFWKSPSTENSPIKIVSVTTLSANSKYFSKSSSLKVRRASPTYNTLVRDFTVLKDVPEDARITVKVWGSRTNHRDFTPLIPYISFGINDVYNKFHQYLPRELIDEIIRNGGVKKGHYTSEDYGFYQFDKLLPDYDLKYPYYKMILNYESGDRVLISLDFRFQSLYINQPHHEGWGW